MGDWETPRPELGARYMLETEGRRELERGRTTPKPDAVPHTGSIREAVCDEQSKLFSRKAEHGAETKRDL